MSRPNASARALEAARRATFKLMADVIAEGGQFDSPLHRLAIAAMNSAKDEPAFWDAARALPDEESRDLTRRINAKKPMLRQLALAYLRAGVF